MCSRVWPKRELILLCLVAKIVENHTRLDACQPVLGINLVNCIHIFGHVDYNRNIAALSSKACASATRKNWRVVESTCRYGLLHIILIPGDDDAYWHLPVIRRVCGI